MADWLVALEAAPGRWDGSLSDVARHLRAVGEIRAEPASGKYSVLVRRHEADPAEALQSAIADWQHARMRSGQVDARLVAARVVVVPDGAAVPDDVDGGEGGEGSERSEGGERVDIRRRVSSGLARAARPMTLAGAALLVVLVAIAVAGVSTNRSSRRPSFVAPVASQNLLTEGSMETAKGFGHQFHPWGSQHLALVAKPVVEGHHAVRVVVPDGQTGGFWAEVPVEPGSAYEASAAIQVSELAAGSRLEMSLEWYDGSHQLVGYRMLGVPTPDDNLVRRVQQAVAPATATTARLAINMTHGGTYVVDDERLAPVPSPASVR